MKTSSASRLYAGFTLLVLTATQAAAQTIASSPSATSTSSDPVQLTPFEVSAGQDKGYVGQDTLAGSRLRTNLKDLAAAISPMTAEFLSDIAATNIIEATEYGVGTRVDTDDARSAGPVGDGYNDSIRSIRVRGLPGAGRSINFFGAPGEVDTYIVDRIDVSRGPNSILYGFGSPAGRLNVTTKQAQTNKNTYAFSNRIDDWGGERWTADANLVLIKNKLALRAVTLRGREDSWRASGNNDQDRYFLAAKWQIDRKTTLKAEYEQGDIKRFVPRPFFGNDNTSIWDASGQPIFNNFSATYVPGTPGTGATGTPGTPIRDSGTTNVVGVQERSGGDWVVVSNRFSTAQNYRQFTYSEAPTGGLLANDFSRGRSNPKATPEANWVSGNFKVHNFSTFLQREIARGVNAEIAFNRQTSQTETRNLASWNHYGVSADTNLYQPNGQLRPAGNLYYYDVSPDRRPSSAQVNQGRATLSFEKGYRDWVNVRLAGLGEMSASKTRSQILQQYWLKGPSLASGGVFNATPENSANQVYYRYYLDSLKQLDDPNFRIPGPLNLSGATPYQDPRTGTVSNIYMREFNRAQGNIGYTDRNTSAYMGVGQVYLWKERIVGTFGYRKDRLKNWVGVAVRDPAGEAVAPNTGVWTPVDPSTAKYSVFTGQTRTTGGVVHFTNWISGFVNTSNSLSTPGTNYITPTDPNKNTIADLVRSPSGKTTDYGLKLTLLSGRIFVTGTKFHTVSKDEFGFSGFNKGNVVNIWTALGNSTALNASETAVALKQAEIINQVQGYMQDSESRGVELEVVGRITQRWSVSANYSKNETVKSNIAREYRAYIDYWKPYWLKYKDLALPQNTTLPRPQNAPSSVDWRTATEIANTGDFTVNTDSINEAIADAESAFFDNPYVFQGKRNVGDPLHSVNLRTRYDFATGWAKGLSIGAGTRMRWERVAGARSEYTFKPGSSYTDALNGRTLTTVTTVNAKDQNVYDAQIGYARNLLKNKIKWSIQLNVNNLTNQRELIVNNLHPRTLAPLTYRYQDPRQLILTNTVSF